MPVSACVEVRSNVSVEAVEEQSYSRNARPVIVITLCDVDADNYDACLDLGISAEQVSANFADPVFYSLAEAYVFRDITRPLAIYADDALVGFVLLAFEDDGGQIVNFIIDQRYQNRGYGKTALSACIDRGDTHFFYQIVSIEPTNKIAERLYESFGFIHTGEFSEYDDGKALMRLDLASPVAPSPKPELGWSLPRRVRASDAPAVLDAFHSAPDMARQGAVTDLASAQAYVDQLLDDSHHAFAIDADSRLVGLVAISVDKANRSGWIWYWIHADHRGKGLVSNAVQAVSDWAISSGMLDRLELGVRVNNPASIQIAEQSGFVLEGVERQKFLIDGKRIDARTYARLRSDV